MDDASNAPCPGCGRTGTKLVHVPLAAKVTLKATLEATAKSSREFFEKNTKYQIVLILLIFLPNLAGLVLPVWIGTVLGLICGVVGYFLGPKAIKTVREITKEKWKG